MRRKKKQEYGNVFDLTIAELKQLAVKTLKSSNLMCNNQKDSLFSKLNIEWNGIESHSTYLYS